MKAPITRDELKRRLLECGGISPDDAENAAVMRLLEDFEDMEEDRLAWKRQCKKMERVVESARVEVFDHGECACNVCDALYELDAADAEEK